MAANDNHCEHNRLASDLLHEDPRKPFIESLPFASQFAIWAARSWVTALKLEQPFETVSGDTFRRFNLLGAQRALDELFTVVAHAAGRQIDIRCMKCRYVSPDEIIFHQALAAAQDGRAFVAYSELRHWLAPAAARIAFNPLVRLSEMLAQAKLTLTADLRSMPSDMPLNASMPMPSSALH
jgi:hypothetical protein